MLHGQGAWASRTQASIPGPTLPLGGLILPCAQVGPAPHPHRQQALPALPRMNREHKETCEMDWSDKVEACNIDEACCHYHNQSSDLQFYPHSTKFEERWDLPQGLCTNAPPPPARSHLGS